MYSDKYVADFLLLSFAALAIVNWFLTRLLHGGRPGRRPTVWAGMGFLVAGATSALSLPGGLPGGIDSVTAQALSLGSMVALGGLDLALTAVASVRAALALPAENHLREAARAQQRGAHAKAAGEYLAAVPALRRAGQSQRETAARLAAATALLETGAAAQAADCCRAAVIRAEKAHDAAARGRALLLLGDCSFELDELQAARSAYQEAASAAQAAGELPLIGWAFSRLAWLEYLSGQAAQSRAYVQWATGADPRRRNEPLLASLVLLTGCLALSEGRLQFVQPAIEDAVKFAEGAHDKVQATAARVALGCAHYLEGYTESGLAYIVQQLAGPSNQVSRRVMGTWLVALAVIAAPGSRADSGTFLAHARRLLAGHARLMALADHVADPASAPHLGADIEKVTGLLRRWRPVAPAQR